MTEATRSFMTTSLLRAVGLAALLAGSTAVHAATDEPLTAGQQAAKDAAAALAAGAADEPVILKAPKPDNRRVYVQDPAHFAAVTQQFVIDANTGRVIGMTDGGFLPQPVTADDGSLFAQASTVYERIARGKRTDYIEVFDPETFLPTADIELPQDARFLVGTYQWMNALTPDNNTFLFYQFSPAPSVGVVDLQGKRFDRMLEVPDCYHIFPVSPTRFYMHCRDATLAQVDFADGQTKVTQTEPFHHEDDELLINHPAYSMKTGRLVWPDYTGRIFQADLTEEKANFHKPLEALTEEERAADWRPGGWQQVAYHRPSNQIYLLVDQRDQWRHKTASRFVVVMDAATGERIAKHELKHEIDSINVSQDAEPLLYALSAGTQTLHIFDAASGEELRKVNQLGRGPQLILTHDMEG